jgi:signal transduction histidine kinase
MNRLTLWQRLGLAFAALLLAGWAATAWLQLRASHLHEQEVAQRLARDLAAHIAGHAALMKRDGSFDRDAVRALFGMLMVVNPGAEVYLLGPDGRMEAHDAPQGHVKRDAVDLQPIARFLAGDALPIAGDDPRGNARKVFSAARLQAGGRDAGYVYVVLRGAAHDAQADGVPSSAVLRATLASMAIVAALMLLAGLVAFALITRRLRALTTDVQRFERDGFAAAHEALPPPVKSAAARDEIAQLRQAFAQMARRIAVQWRELIDADRQRRELVANISHDLRTPLQSLHGYLETLALKSAQLGDVERRRYLDTALAQSRKVSRLAQELFELARLEHGAVKPAVERFSLVELTHDVFQKFELAAESRRLKLDADIAPQLPAVKADLGMIERVLTNLLDNALRHTPAGGEVRVELGHADGRVTVQVTDSGPGIAPEVRRTLFTRAATTAAPLPGLPEGAGLGLMIVRRILQLHGSDIELIDRPGPGATFAFTLSAAGA